MKKIKVITFIIFVFVAFPMNSFSEDKKSSLDQRILRLEKIVYSIETLNKKMSDDRKESLDLMKEALLKDFENKKTELQNQNYKDNIFISVFITLVFCAGIFAPVTVYELYYKKRIYKIIGKEFEMAPDHVKEFFKSLKEDFNLKRNKNILVVSFNGVDTARLQSYLKSSGFGKNVKYKKIGEDEDVDVIGYDVLLFYNANWNDFEEKKILKFNTIFEEKEKIREILEKNNKHNLLRFYFGEGYINFKDDKKKGLLASANLRSQLYGNLMNALRYQDKL